MHCRLRMALPSLKDLVNFEIGEGFAYLFGGGFFNLKLAKFFNKDIVKQRSRRRNLSDPRKQQNSNRKIQPDSSRSTYVVCTLFFFCPKVGSEAKGDLALIQTSAFVM